MPSNSREKVLKQLSRRLPELMIKDRYAIRRELFRLKNQAATGRSGASLEASINSLQHRMQSSIKKASRRQNRVPTLSYNETLPIFSKKDDIIRAIEKHPVLIVSGETGSGKTTQIPKFCLAAGRGIKGKIGCTQPRRIAAVTVSERISEELGEAPGHSVGYKIRFSEKGRPQAFIKIMTDGILLAEAQADPYLNEYDTVIVDEAHERSLNIDFVLGILKSLLKTRNDLKLIITSATIDTEKFSKAFDHAPVIEVSGRLYPVDVVYFRNTDQPENNGEQTHVEMALSAFDDLERTSSSGDVLIFMPTEQDILETVELIEARRYAGISAIPLYARLPAGEQSRAFKSIPGRKVIVATNVAETSITIPGIKYVIDTGLARISRYSPRTRTTSLPVVPVSKSSADQRKGRCGRVENGVCIRLFSETDFQSRPLFTPPEILRANLAEVILRMIALNLGEVSDFPFIDEPNPKSVQDGFHLLYELGALAEAPSNIRSKKKKPARLTKTGRLLSRMPLDPRLSRMIIQAKTENCLEDIAVIAAALSIQDPRQRPIEHGKEADRIHQTFIHPSSDFLTLLNIWYQYHAVWRAEKSTGKMRKYCKAHFLSYRRIREWRDIFSQISGILKEAGMGGPLSAKDHAPAVDPAESLSDKRYAAIHRSILSGFLSNIAMKKEKNIFKATKGREIMIFPGSALFNRAGAWIVAAEIVETTRPFARIAANIDSNWLENIGKDLCTYAHFDPHWEKDREEVAAFEQVSLFGLPIIPKRQVAYGRIKPEDACRIFILEALVRGRLKKPLPFMAHNLKIADDILKMENRLRRRDLLVSEDEQVQFYFRHLKGIFNIRGLRKRLKKEGDDRFLRMTREDLLNYSPDALELSLFPDTIQLGNRRFSCVYRFDPDRENDGVTVEIPKEVAPTVPLGATDWMVPGLLKDRITALIKSLPKAYRKKLVPVSRTAAIIAHDIPKTKAAFFPALSRFIGTRFGVTIPPSAWSENALPGHLSMRIALTGQKGEELHASRNKSHVLEQAAKGALLEESEEIRSAKKCWEASGITAWDFGNLPEQIHVKGKNHAGWTLYPGLRESDDGRSVARCLFSNRRDADRCHRAGVAVLFLNYFSKDLKFLKKQLRLSEELRQPADYFGGASRLEKRLFQSVQNHFFRKNIRTREAFERHAESISSEMFSYGTETFAKASAILHAYHACRSALFGLEKANMGSQRFMAFLDHLRRELNKLIPENFMYIYALEKFPQLEKYVRTIEIRAQRGILNFEKEHLRSKELKAYTDRLDVLVAGLDAAASEEKRTAIEELFWIIEEYKVSLFAQELKTAMPVSKKRLDKKIEAIESMI